MALMELLQDVVPPGVINVVTGYGAEAGSALAKSKGIAKLGFTGSTDTGKAILKEAAESLIPVTLELGGKSPNIFFSSVMDADDAFLDKAVEGAVLFALNQGEVCTCQSRLLVQEDIFERFMERVVQRTEAIVTGDPLDPNTMMGAQVSPPPPLKPPKSHPHAYACCHRPVLPSDWLSQRGTPTALQRGHRLHWGPPPPSPHDCNPVTPSVAPPVIVLSGPLCPRTSPSGLGEAAQAH